MQNPYGHVISISSDRSVRKVVVEVKAGIACERCASGKGCGAGLLGNQPGERHVEAIVAADSDVECGDLVSIALQPSSVLKAAVIVYGYPLAVALIGAIAAYSLGLSDIGASATALGGLIVGIIFARSRLNSAACLRTFTPMVVGRLTGVGD